MSAQAANGSPDLRATLSDSGLFMTRWHAHLVASSGPYGCVVRDRVTAAAVLDLTIVRTATEGQTSVASDLIVTEVIPPADGAPRRTVLCWAASLGYRRAWWRGELIELAASALGGTWRTRCLTCRSDWSDDSHGFWLSARGAGFFPLTCALCGHALAQSTMQTPPTPTSQWPLSTFAEHAPCT